MTNPRIALAAVVAAVSLAIPSAAAAGPASYRDTYYWSSTPPEEQALMIACDAEMNAYARYQAPGAQENDGGTAYAMGSQSARNVLKATRAELEAAAKLTRTVSYDPLLVPIGHLPRLPRPRLRVQFPVRVSRHFQTKFARPNWPT